MSKIIRINQFSGMKNGGSYFLMGFQPAFMGKKQILRQEWKTTHKALTASGPMRGGCLLIETGKSYVDNLALFTIDYADIYKCQAYNAADFAKDTDIIETPSNKPDIIKGLNGTILYTSAQYLGRRQTGTDNSSSDNKGTSMVDTSRNFDDDGVVVGSTLYNTTDKCKGVITSITTTTNTNDTLNCSGGFAGGTDDDFDDGDGYAVYADKFQDLGAEQVDWSRQIFTFENLHLIGNGNYLAAIDKDDANFNASYKQLREDWIFQAGATNSGKVAVACNKDYKGRIAFWDGWSDGWINEIDLDKEVDTIKAYSSGWIFNAGALVYYTDGNSKVLISKFPDLDEGMIMNIYPNGLLIVGDKAIFNYEGYGYGLAKSGLWVLDLKKRDWVYNPFPAGSMNSAGSGGLFFHPKRNKIFFGHQYSGTYKFAVLQQNYNGAAPDQSVFVFPVKLRKERQITKIEIDWAKNSLAQNIVNAQTVDITVSVGDTKKHFWGYGLTNGASDTEGTLEIDNSVDNYNKVEEGNEILILSSLTTGQERAFILSIAGAGTNSCVLTLDRDLSGKTENAKYFNIFPVKKAKGVNTYTKIETAIFYPEPFLSAEAIVEIWVKASNFPIQLEEIRLFITN